MQIAVKMFEQRAVSLLYVKQKNYCRAREGLGTSSAPQCFTVPIKTAGDKGKLFVFFIPFFTLFLFNKIVCSLYFSNKLRHPGVIYTRRSAHMSVALAWMLSRTILVFRAHDPSGLRQGSRGLAGPDFLRMRRVFLSYSQPIRFARFDGKSVNRRLPVLD